MENVGKLTEARMVKPVEPKTYPLVSDKLFEAQVKMKFKESDSQENKERLKRIVQRRRKLAGDEVKESSTPKPVRQVRAREKAGKPVKKGTEKIASNDVQFSPTSDPETLRARKRGKSDIGESSTPKILRRTRKRAQAGKPLKKGTAKVVAGDPKQDLGTAMAAGDKLSTEGSRGIKRLGRVRIGLRKNHRKAVSTMIKAKNPAAHAKASGEQQAALKKSYSNSFKIGAKEQDGRNRTNKKRADEIGAKAAGVKREGQAKLARAAKSIDRQYDRDSNKSVTSSDPDERAKGKAGVKSGLKKVYRAAYKQAVNKLDRTRRIQARKSKKAAANKNTTGFSDRSAGPGREIDFKRDRP